MFENTQLAIAWVAVVCAALSFILHLAFSIGLIITPAQKAEAEVRASFDALKLAEGGQVSQPCLLRTSWRWPA